RVLSAEPFRERNGELLLDLRVHELARDRRVARAYRELYEGHAVRRARRLDEHRSRDPHAERRAIAREDLHRVLARGREHRGEETLLAAEVAADQGGIDARIGRDRPQASVVVPVLHEAGSGGLKDRLASARG